MYLPWYAAGGTCNADTSGRYPGVNISINKLSVSVSPICLSELVAMVPGDGFTPRSDIGYCILNTK